MSKSRQQLLAYVLPAAGLSVLAGCSRPRPATFEVRAEEAVSLRIVITSGDNQDPVYNQLHSFKSGDVLDLDETTLKHPPYNIELRMKGETMWESSIGTCNHAIVSVDRTGNVDIIDWIAC